MKRFCQLYPEILAFLSESDHLDVYAEIMKEPWRLQLAFITDLMEIMNSLNLELQGKYKFILEQYNNVRNFIELLGILISQLSRGVFVKFTELSNLVDTLKIQILPSQLKSMTKFLQDLRSHMEKRFVYIKRSYTCFEFVDFPFLNDNEDIAKYSENLILSLFVVKTVRDLNSEGKKFLKSLDTEILQFRPHKTTWIKYKDSVNDTQVVWQKFAKVVSMNSFPLISRIVARVLSQFGSSWLNESGFSTMKIIKSKYRSALSENNLDSCMRVALYDGEIFLDEVMKFRKSKKRDESTLKSNETEVSQHQEDSSSDEDDDD